ncbi:MAG: serine/threonine protein kinase [Cyanosarcina radialis HA8281-LM2]|jgi:serine/threonine protein kinase|nr:serine/threonine protein kinase [Cyanosarcina radialis HA8281-LM2]
MTIDRALNESFPELIGGRYQVLQRLGERVGRETLLARNLETQELVVVKLLLLSEDFEWQHLKLFEREAQTLQALSHPAIPCYVDYLEIDEPHHKSFALVQSYIAGKSLEEHLKSGRTFSNEEVKELAKLLLEILIYLQRRQPPVIHRDIKPSNILLTERSGNSIGQVYLVDFGSVQTLAAKEGGTITVVGTYGYMPPEQFGGRTTPASDLYSLGATLIYVITGLHPTELPQQDFRIQFRQILTGRSIDRDFISWLEWMTEPSLEKRLSSASQALEALQNPQPRPQLVPVVKQPAGSEVLLTKKADLLEILIPPEGLGFGAIALISFVTPLLFWIIHWSITYNEIILIFLDLGLAAFLLRLILWGLFRQIRLQIDREKISVTNELLGIKWPYSRPSPRADLCHLEMRSNLIIITKKGKYELFMNHPLTSEELYWLATELSDRLGLPISYS